MYVEIVKLKFVLGLAYISPLVDIIKVLNNSKDQLTILNDRYSLDKVENKRGIILREYMEDLGLRVINSRTPSDKTAQFTNISPLCCSVINLVLVNDKDFDFIIDLEVSLIPVQFGHLPLILTIKNTKFLKKDNKITYISWKKDLVSNKYKCMYFK